jgi:heme oxygenase
MTSTSTSASERFSKALKSMTWDDHAKAEHTAYMEALLDGTLNQTGYAELAAQHYYMYEVIEAAAEKMRDDAVAGKFVFDELLRMPALVRDLEFLIGSDWRDKISPNEATKEYCDRMREVCFDWPGGYIAHSYTRYLGDLSGGQNIRAALVRAFGYKDGTGVEFYSFPEIEDVWAFKDTYRALLDAAPWDEQEQQRVIDEALLAYKYNTDVTAVMGREMSKYLK